MKYREFLPHPSLSLWVERLWTNVRTPDSRQTGALVFPDGCIDIVMVHDEGQEEIGCRLVGAMSFARRFELRERSWAVGVRFSSGGARGLLGIHARQHQDQLPSLAEVLGYRSFQWVGSAKMSLKSLISDASRMLSDFSKTGRLDAS